MACTNRGGELYSDKCIKVNRLTCWPQQPVCLQTRKIALLELLPRTTTFHDGHGRQEASEIGRSEDSLISKNSSCDSGAVILKIDLALQQLIPLSGSRPKNSFMRSALASLTSPLCPYLLRKGPYALILLNHDLRTLFFPPLAGPRYRQQQTAPELPSQQRKSQAKTSNTLKELTAVVMLCVRSGRCVSFA